MDRYWLLTNTCYGNRLPGDACGFVGRVWEHRSDDPEEKARSTHNLPGTPCDEDMPGLERQSRTIMKGPPVRLMVEHAEVLLAHIQETAGFRGWAVYAVAIMVDHVHIVVGVEGDPNPSKVLGDFKSWGTRALTRRFGEPTSITWWTECGSKRKLCGDVADAVPYVLFEQFAPLLTWSPETGLHYGPPPIRD